MELQLKNIGMIKEANVKIDGLTVIAGENDTGKSTVGKALYLYLKDESQDFSLLTKFLFENQLSTKLPLKSNKNFIAGNIQINKKKKSYTPIFIETPLVWSFIETFKNVIQIGHQTGIRVNIPYLMNDLAIKLTNTSIKNDAIDISYKTKKIMQGNFKKDDKGIFFFEKDEIRIELINTATGIKYFGILQILSNNRWLSKDNILILDEPEVHLHPKWQLEIAKIIVELVKNGVKIVVNSHSPYMIEALKRYSDLEKIENKTNFYLAEDGYIKQINNSNSETLEKIFEKLSEPFDTFEEMDSQSMERLING